MKYRLSPRNLLQYQKMHDQETATRGAPSLLESRLKNSSVYHSIDVPSKGATSVTGSKVSPRLNNGPSALGNHSRKREDPFVVRKTSVNPLNNFNELKDITVDHFRPENAHLLRAQPSKVNNFYGATPTVQGSVFDKINKPPVHPTQSNSPSKMNAIRSLQAPNYPYHENHVVEVTKHRNIPSMPSPAQINPGAYS
mmetsp:Transcript_17108/g.26455  ORF Transcript_17108/g.26455 Transcript_17108/m.26455 type:complete len:196 (+) Transcript_17108:311-898(+)